MKLLRHIPNILSLTNLFLGCIAVVYAFQGLLVQSALFVFIAGIIDFSDGFIARWLKATSDLGKQLDSLADVVTFGVVPGVVIYQLLTMRFQSEFFALQIPVIKGFPAFLLTVFAALRLGKFNIDSRQSENFIGLPTPAMAMFIISLPVILFYNRYPLSDIILNTYFLYGVVGVFSILMVSGIPMFGMKFKHFGLKGNIMRYLFLLLSAGAILVLKETGIAATILLYIILSLINNLFQR